MGFVLKLLSFAPSPDFGIAPLPVLCKFQYSCNVYLLKVILDIHIILLWYDSKLFFQNYQALHTGAFKNHVEKKGG